MRLQRPHGPDAVVPRAFVDVLATIGSGGAVEVAAGGSSGDSTASGAPTLAHVHHFALAVHDHVVRLCSGTPGGSHHSDTEAPGVNTSALASAPPAIFATVNLLNTVSKDAVAAAWGLVQGRPQWHTMWHRRTNRLPPPRVMLGPNMVLVAGEEVYLAAAIASHTRCWKGKAQGHGVSSEPVWGVPVPLVVLGMEEDMGLLQGPKVVRQAWSLALQADEATWFPRYRPFPVAGLSIDHFQLVQGFQDAMRTFPQSQEDLSTLQEVFDRSDDLFELLPIQRFKGATIMDFGANLGQTSARALLCGASAAIAVEGWASTAAKGAVMVGNAHLHGLTYLHLNFHDLDFDVTLDTLVPQQVDIVMVLSIYRNVDLGHRDRMLAYALRRAAVGVVLEGHATVLQDSVDMYTRLLGEMGCPPDTLTLLGWSVLVPERSRPVLWIDTPRCTLRTIPFDAVVQQLRDLRGTACAASGACPGAGGG